VFSVLSAYIDDSGSKDGRILCLGGWLCADTDWASIEAEWRSRIEMEQRNSINKGFPPIQRYHAADCSSLVNEFDREKGWDNDRQLRLAKKLIEILTKKRKEPVMGFAVSASMDNYRIAYPTHRAAEKNVYRHLDFGTLIWPSSAV